jgi:CcmD family protein
MKKIALLLISILLTATTFAQTQQVEMADTMRANGKIYVVVAIVLTVLLGFIVYLVSIDRKLSKLEKELKK